MTITLPVEEKEHTEIDVVHDLCAPMNGFTGGIHTIPFGTEVVTMCGAKVIYPDHFDGQCWKVG